MPTIFLLCLYALLPAFSNAQEDVQERLRKEYLNTTQVLRGFPDSASLKYGSDGLPVHTYAVGPWTVYGQVHLTALNLKNKKLEITAQRYIVLFDDDKQKLTAVEWKNEQVFVEIATVAGPGQLQQLEQAMHAVFIGSAEVASAFPDYWVPYLSKITDQRNGCETRLTAAKLNGKTDTTVRDGGSGQRSDLSSSAPPAGGEDKSVDPGTPTSSDAASPTKIRVSQEVIQGSKIKDVAPQYPTFDKRAHIQGTVLLDGTIGKTGDVTCLAIRQPAGGGLDEAAVEAVRQWKYRPYSLNGNPVIVETVIKIRFHF